MTALDSEDLLWMACASKSFIDDGQARSSWEGELGHSILFHLVSVKWPSSYRVLLHHSLAKVYGFERLVFGGGPSRAAE